MTAYILLAVILAVLIISTVMGYKKGLLKTLLGMASLLVSLILVYLFTGTVTNLLEEHTPIREKVYESVYEKLEEKAEAARKEKDAAEESILEAIFPESLLKLFEKDEKTEKDTKNLSAAANTLTDLIVKGCGLLLTFILAFIAVTLAMWLLGIIDKIPGLKEANKTAGGLLGFLRGAIFVWLLCLLITCLGHTDFGADLVQQIEDNKICAFIYNGVLTLTAMLKLLVF